MLLYHRNQQELWLIRNIKLSFLAPTWFKIVTALIIIMTLMFKHHSSSVKIHSCIIYDISRTVQKLDYREIYHTNVQSSLCSYWIMKASGFVKCALDSIGCEESAEASIIQIDQAVPEICPCVTHNSASRPHQVCWYKNKT